MATSQTSLLSANEIIPLAEKTGLILPIGKWILLTACQQAKTWHQDGLHFAKIAVNISILQAKNSSLKKLVFESLEQTKLLPKYLSLELTETSYAELTDIVLNEMQQLKEAGVELVIDDFGIGYSGLANIKRLPVSKLKIDQSFIKDIFTDANDKAITLAIISMAHQLDLTVIAEGVENKDQYHFLKENWVDEMQGYFFCPPKNAYPCELMLDKFNVATLS